MYEEAINPVHFGFGNTIGDPTLMRVVKLVRPHNPGFDVVIGCTVEKRVLLVQCKAHMLATSTISSMLRL